MKSRGFLIIGGIVIALIAILIALNTKDPGTSTTGKDAGAKTAEIPGLVPEEERAKYIEQFVTTSSVTVKADMVPDGEGGEKRVAGLLRVRGLVKNNGDRPVRPVRLLVTTHADDDKVLGTYLEEITVGEPLRAGEQREFTFTIPDKKEFNGKFQHKLR